MNTKPKNQPSPTINPSPLRPSRPLRETSRTLARTRSQFARHDRIKTLLQETGYPNCQQLAAEFQVTTKTILRDIEFLRDHLRLPIDYCPHRHGYYFTKPVSEFPPVQLTERELFSLFCAQNVIACYQDTDVQHSLAQSFKKILACLDNRARTTLDHFGEIFTFRPFAPEVVNLRTFDLVTAAVQRRRTLRFSYRKPGEKTITVRTADPYHLTHHTHRWYLLAYDHGARAIRHFVLARMTEVQETIGTFAPPAGFDPAKHLSRSLGIMAGADDYLVIIELDAWLTDILRGRCWHRSQIWHELPGGGSRLELRLSCLEEIAQAVLSWGAHATVIQPQALVQRITRTAIDLMEKYAPAVLPDEPPVVLPFMIPSLA